MDLNKTGIYIIENIINKKFYIGSTNSSFSQRFKEHMKSMKKNKHHSIRLQNSVNKYGVESFRFEILEYIDCPVECRKREQVLITELLPNYNMTHVVNRAIVYTEELSRKMSESHGGRPFEAYKSDTFIGIFYSQGYFAKQYNIQPSKVHLVLKGTRKSTGGYKFKYVNEDFKYIKKGRKKADLSMRVWNKHTDETKVLISKSSKNRKVSIDTKTKLSIITKQNLKNGKHKMPDFSNKQVKINLAKSLFKGILHVYYQDVFLKSYTSILEASDDLALKSSSIANCLNGRRNSLYKYTFKKEVIND